MVSKFLPVVHHELENINPNIPPRLFRRPKSAPLREDDKLKLRTPKTDPKPKHNKKKTPIVTITKDKSSKKLRSVHTPKSDKHTSGTDSRSPPLTARELFHERVSNSNSTSNSETREKSLNDIYREDDFNRFLGGVWSDEKKSIKSARTPTEQTELEALRMEYQKIQGRLDQIEKEKELLARENERQIFLADSEKHKELTIKLIKQLEEQLHHTRTECDQLKTNFREYRLQNDLITKQLQQQIDDLRNRQMHQPIMYYSPSHDVQAQSPLHTPPRQIHGMDSRLSGRLMVSGENQSPPNLIASMPATLPKPVLLFDTKSPVSHSSPLPRSLHPKPIQSSPYLTYQQGGLAKQSLTPDHKNDRTIVQNFVDNGQEPISEETADNNNLETTCEPSESLPDSATSKIVC
jgi:hypothetical protein